MKRIARESKRAILETLADVVGEPSRNFEFHVGMRDGYAAHEPPKSAEKGPLKVEVRGGSRDAGLILDALAPDHEVRISLRVPIAMLRQIEALTGETFYLVEYTEVRAEVAAATADKIRTAHTAPAPGSCAAIEDPCGDAIERALQAFIGSRVIREPGARLKAADAYAAYLAWCTETRNTPMASQSNQYGAAWSSIGIEKTRLKTGVHYLNVRLKDGDE